MQRFSAQRQQHRRLNMNKAMRMLTLVGMGLMASATIGATPALAADGAGQAAAKKPVVKVQQHRDNDWIAGYYRSARACERACSMLVRRINRGMATFSSAVNSGNR
jgi:hypothetical protein